MLQRYVADLGHAWPVLVVCGGIAPLLLSLVWLVIIRIFVGAIIWITIALLNIATIAVTVWFYIKGTCCGCSSVPFIRLPLGVTGIETHICGGSLAAGWIGSDAVSGIIGDNAAEALSLETSHTVSSALLDWSFDSYSCRGVAFRANE